MQSKEEKATYDRLRREKLRPQLIAISRQWRIDNPERKKENDRKWREEFRAAGSTRNSWRCMRQRCDDPNKDNYHNYGGRGISYDPRWAVYANFVEDMGERPLGKTLDRTDNDGPYNKDNCTWSTTKAQRINQRPRRAA